MVIAPQAMVQVKALLIAHYVLLVGIPPEAWPVLHVHPVNIIVSRDQSDAATAPQVKGQLRDPAVVMCVRRVNIRQEVQAA